MSLIATVLVIVIATVTVIVIVIATENLAFLHVLSNYHNVLTIHLAFDIIGIVRI